MYPNTSTSLAKNILDTIIDNGRVESSTNLELAKDGVSCRASLIAEIEIEANERGINSESALEDIVNYALRHCSHD